MKIQDSSIQMSSSHFKREDYQFHEQLDMRVGNSPGATGGASGLMVSAERTIQSRTALFQNTQSMQTSRAETDEGEDVVSIDSKLAQTAFLLERLLGQKIELVAFQAHGGSGSGDSSPPKAPPRSGNESTGSALSLRYERTETFSEEEVSSFRARGTVRTEKGEEIEFDLNLQMERAYAREDRLLIQIGDNPVDPLVINFSGRPAELLAETTEFDLDSDGNAETVYQLAPHSAYLAYDRNGDGIVNNGGELFGPSTGEGFEELAVHDQDQNGWIDENDSIYGSLSLWKQGSDNQLQSLADAGIGAIYLDHVETPFELNDPQTNASRGAVLETGVYLSEAGEVGSVQELGLTVET